MIWLGDQDSGSLVPQEEALVSVRDLGLMSGAGVFETLKAVDGQPFALTRHLRRLRESVERMGLPLLDDALLRGAVAEVLTANAPLLGPLARLRITYTAGVDGLRTLAVTSVPIDPWAPTTTVVTVPFARNERSPLAGIKSTSYAENVLASRWAQERGASEGVLGNTQGRLCEGTASNVFVVVDGQALTPSLASGCLAGVTRDLLLEWTDAHEADLPMDVLQRADEVFLSSSTRNVHPVARLDDRVLPAPGPVTAAMAAAFAERAALDIDP